MHDPRRTETLNGPAFDTTGWADDGPPARRLAAVDPEGHARQRIAELAEELGGMAATVGEVDPRSAERLEDLSRSIGNPDGRARWSEVDLRRAFQTDRLAHAYAVGQAGRYSATAIAAADRVRNVLVLAPILLTWFALAEASRAYASFIEENPDEVRQPFLLLWQTGFGGHANSFAPTFSQVAFLDAAIIAIIIALTLFTHGRREDREDLVEHAADSFQSDLDNVLSEATVVLARDRAGRPAQLATGIERLADRFDRSSQELLTRLRLEHDRLEQLASRREREFADFGVFASGMRAGAEETHRLLVELRGVSSGLQTALEDLTTEVGVSTDQGRTLLVAIQGLERLTTTDIQSDQALTRQIANAAETLADAAEKAISGVDAAAQAARIATDAGRAIGVVAQSLAAGQSRVEDAVAKGAEANTRLAESLRGAGGGIGNATRTLQEIDASLASMRDGFSAVVSQSTEHAATLRALLGEQEAIASGLAEVARDIGAISIGAAQRQESANRDISALVNRLDTVVEAMATSARTPRRVEASETDASRGDPTRLWPQRRST
ncbi:MAG: hypothetical protein IT337_09610 [Thermomicrobiales bacterium]|nr:hypothetical protein [Thermomicrobiales bacterium]